MKTSTAHGAVKGGAPGAEAAASVDTTTPLRYAHLWTAANGIVTTRVPEFPLEIRCGAVVYACELDAKGQPRVNRGRRTGVESVEYRKRRPIAATDLEPEGDVLIVRQEDLREL